MINRTHTASSSLLMLAFPVAALLGGCLAHPGTGADSQWRHQVLWEGPEKIQSVAIGEVAHDRDGLEVIGIDALGKVIMISRIAQSPEAEVLYEHGAKLTGLLIADLDPAVAGIEIYVGGHRPGGSGGSGGAVVQLVRNQSHVTSRIIWVGEGFVHALAHLEHAPPDASPALIITSYAGEIHLASPQAADGPWACRLLHREPETGDPEDLEIKDVVAGSIGGAPAPSIFVAVKSGRGVLLDVNAQAAAEVLHTERGGIARLALDASGDLLLAGNEGLVVRLTPDSGGWRSIPLYREVGKLRGIVTGRFRTPGHMSGLAVIGYAGLLRLLSEHEHGCDSLTVYDDGDRGHWLAAGDVIPGNDSDELVLAGYSGRIVLAYFAQTAQRRRVPPRSKKAQ